MEAIRSLWTRDSRGYSSLNGMTSSQSSQPSNDHDSRLHSPTTPKSFEPRPLIFWRTEPNFQVEVNFRGLGRHIMPTLLVLLPSFIRSPKNKKPKKLFPTSYLDGVRGVAAFFVLIHHYTVQYTVESATGWGWEKRPAERHDWFFYLPIIRVVHAGRFMVVIFFILSGYVLSHRSLQLARQGKHLQLLDSLASSVFRRWLRLHMPVAASCFLAFMFARMDLYNHMPKGWEHNPDGQSFIQEQFFAFPSRKGTFSSQFMDLFYDTRQLINPFNFGRIAISKYNIGILWTISIEWMGSMLVFVTVLGICRTKTWVKFSVLALLYYHSHKCVKWEWACFFAGIFLAELSFIWARPLPTTITPSSPSEEKALPTLAPIKRYASPLSKLFFTFLFLTGIYLGTGPRKYINETPGYKYLYTLIPKQYINATEHVATFWPSIGGIFLIFSLEMAPFLQSIFTTRFAQYLGEISFSLYMVHLQIEYTLGEWIVPKCMNLTGGWANGQAGFVSGMVLALMICWPVTFWVADVFTRVVDEKCVKFARWVSDKAFVKI